MALHRSPTASSPLRGSRSPLVLIALLTSATSCGGSAVTVTPTPTPVRVPRACTPGEWATSLVDAAPNALAPAVALDRTGALHVSYHDFTEVDLRYAHRTLDGVWTTETVDSEGSVGYPSSIAVDSSGRVYVSYHRFDGADLKLASRAPGEAWAVETVESAENVGFQSSVAVDRDDRVHIAYYADPGGEGDHLRHAARAPGGDWTIEVVDAQMEDATRNPPPFLALDGEGTVHIMYIGSREEAPPRLRPVLHARRAAGEAWTTDEIDRVSSTDSGFEPFMSIDDRGGLHVTYHRPGTPRDPAHAFRELVYAHRSATGSWSTISLPWPRHVAGTIPVVGDDRGRLHFLYLNVDPDGLQLASGNPADGWERSMIATPGRIPTQLASSVVAVDPEGGTHVIYRRDQNRLAHAYRPPCAE